MEIIQSTNLYIEPDTGLRTKENIECKDYPDGQLMRVHMTQKEYDERYKKASN